MNRITKLLKKRHSTTAHLSISLTRYFEEKGICLDNQQHQAAKILDNLLSHTSTKSSGLFRRQTTSGVYLWGLPGRGKTMLMDSSYKLVEHLAKRIHYHQFLRDLHRKMSTSSNNQLDQMNDWVDRLVGNSRLFCLDEFHLLDVADTMLMEQFLRKLFDKGVNLILTSNYVPEQLLADPIRHPLALPTIQLIYRHLTVVSLQGDHDYRYRGKPNEHYYYSPCGTQANQHLRHTLKILGTTLQKADSVTLSGRSVTVVATSQQAVWFSFDALCQSARSHLDYLEIAERWQVVVVADIYQQQLNQLDALRRFIWLIDVLYDTRRYLLLSSEQPITDMLRNLSGVPDITRAISRLAEMQSAQLTNET